MTKDQASTGSRSSTGDFQEQVLQEFKGLKKQLDKIDGDLVEARRQIMELDSRSERQERRLAAIETYPSPPMRQPGRLYATEADSVSLPRRERVGRAG